MRIGPISPVASAIHAQALAAVEGALIAGLTDNAAIAVNAARSHDTSPDAARPAPATPPPPDPARVAVDQAKAAAAASQTSLAPMFADLAAALNSPATPPQLRTALANVLALRIPVGATFTGPQLHRAVSESGVMLEAKLAAGLAPGRDLKAALLDLLGGLRNLSPPRATAMPAAPPPLAQHAGMLTEEAHPSPVETLRVEARPPPPLRDASLNPQRAEVSSLPAVRAGEVAPRLVADVEHAVARQVLHQIASMPQGSDGPTWMFELPFLTPQGATVAQFAIHRDDTGHGAASESGPTWRARFAMEVDPLGPVHVDLRLGGGQRSHVTLWAGEAGLARMAPDSDLLGRTLDADVTMRPGAPHEAPTATPGQFVDRRS